MYFIRLLSSLLVFLSSTAFCCDYLVGSEALLLLKQLPPDASITVHSGIGTKDPVCFISAGTLAPRITCDISHPDDTAPACRSARSTSLNQVELQELLEKAPQYILDRVSCYKCRK